MEAPQPARALRLLATTLESHDCLGQIAEPATTPGKLLGGRVGSGMGAVLASMRACEQTDALDSLSIDSFKFHNYGLHVSVAEPS